MIWKVMSSKRFSNLFYADEFPGTVKGLQKAITFCRTKAQNGIDSEICLWIFRIERPQATKLLACKTVKKIISKYPGLVKEFFNNF